MTRSLLLAALTIVCVSATWSPAQTHKVRVNVPASQATFEIELPSGPTAADLSKPDALQSYVLDSLKKTGRCQLPPGFIRIAEPLKLHWVHGGTIEGAGPAYAGADSTSGWRRDKKVIQANTVIVGSDPSKPVLDLSAVIGLELANLAIETTGVGVLYCDKPGGGSTNNTLRRVSFHGCRVAFQAGQQKTDPNSADVAFLGVAFHRCGACLEVNNEQGVNYLFDNLCSAMNCERFAVLNAGGIVDLQHVIGMNVGEWVYEGAGGGNNQPSTIARLYSDRDKHVAPPVIVNAAAATGHYRVLVDGVKVTYHGVSDEKQWPGFVTFRQSPLAQTQRSTITVRDNETINWPAGVVSAPTVVEVAK